MKNTYKKIMLLAVMLTLIVIKAGAQPLSGLYTINSAAPTSGSNFQSFSAFAATVNANGIAGPVEVNVVASSGPYIEQVQFNQITGMGGSTKVTINGNGNTLQFNSSNSAAPHTLLLNGTDYLVVNDLNVIGQGSTYAMACVLTNNANSNYFNRCTFSVPLNGTSVYQCPFSITGSASYPLQSGNTGHYNTVMSSTMTSGYGGYISYGTTAAPFTTGNSVINCRITDWYLYGAYFYSNQDFTMKGTTIDRATRTTISTTYPLYAAYNNNCMLDGNKITKLFDGVPGSTATMYWYMYYQIIPGGARNTFRNNIITDIKHNGTMYMYQYYGAWDIYNNTFDWDYAAGNHTGTYYHCYAFSNSTYGNINIYNNIFTFRKPGSGTRYPIYTGGTTGYMNIDRNDIVVGTGSGGNFFGYYTSAATTLAQWQSQGMDLTGFSIDPVYANQATGDLHPTAAAINNTAIPMSLIFDQEGAVRNPNTPDIGALEFLTPQCSGSPGLNSVTTPTYAICPGENVTMGLSNLNANAGFTYQWQSSNISAVGPFTNIAGATSLFYTAPTVTANTYYNLVMTCTVAGGSAANYVGQVMVAGPTTSTVPYYEGFEGIGLGGRLPNCSWYAPNLGPAFTTYISANSGNRVADNFNGSGGTSFASFSAPTTNNYVYTNGIQMEPGITYSAAVRYATEYFGYTNWTNLSIWIGPNQSTVGLVQVANVSPAITGPYKLLDGVFTVPSSGIYYMAIRANGASGSAQYLSIDNISITIPCYGPGASNSPTMNLSASATTVCAGDAVNLTANGADAYVWSPSGSTGPSIVDNPIATTLYGVVGTNTLTGCPDSLSQLVVVNPAPNVFIVPNTPTVCAGSPANLMALGTGIVAYSWSNGGNQPNITVNPTTPTTYTVIATNIDGCSGVATQMIGVTALPVVNAISSIPDVACHNEMVTLTASGGVSYTWYSSTSPVVNVGNPINVIPGAPTVYTIIATNAAGCSNKTTLTQNVTDCTSLTEFGSLTGLNVYPNPTNGMFTIELNTTSVKTIEITDITGRVIASSTSSDVQVNMNIHDLANGIYYVKIQSENASEVIRIVKQ
jgi:hypothetical protein